MQKKLLKSIPIFSSMNTEDLQRLEKLLSLHTYLKERLIVMEKDSGNSTRGRFFW